ncbi:MAG: Rieske 2Fe-2S domain-containing protein [Flavobacteriales bacterium]|nr:Rieske 2Fe-2S domain-containing protein [Flavobacteriales bacterium]
MKRKEAIKGICACVALGAGVTIQSCTSIPMIDHNIMNSKIIVQKSVFIEESFVLIQNERLPASLGVLRSEKKYFAHLLLCTHKSCELQAAGKFLVCPCHGSEFDQKGNVLTGPAMDGLMALPILETASEIEINVKGIIA